MTPGKLLIDPSEITNSINKNIRKNIRVSRKMKTKEKKENFARLLFSNILMGTFIFIILTMITFALFWDKPVKVEKPLHTDNTFIIEK